MAIKRKELNNHDFTIFSCNCIGGIIYHDLGLPFSSPFINLYLSCSDFIRFCEAPDTYLGLELTPMESASDYPIAKLGDLTLHLIHYKNFKDGKEAWDRRKKRIQFHNLFLVATDRDGFTPELSRRFDALPQHKVLFVHRADDNPNHFYIPGYENDGQVGDLTKKKDSYSGKRVLDQFDWIEFLNRER